MRIKSMTRRSGVQPWPSLRQGPRSTSPRDLPGFDNTMSRTLELVGNHALELPARAPQARNQKSMRSYDSESWAKVKIR